MESYSESSTGDDHLVVRLHWFLMFRLAAVDMEWLASLSKVDVEMISEREGVCRVEEFSAIIAQPEFGVICSKGASRYASADDVFLAQLYGSVSAQVAVVE